MITGFLAGVLTTLLVVVVTLILAEDWTFRAAQLRGHRTLRRRRRCTHLHAQHGTDGTDTERSGRHLTEPGRAVRMSQVGPALLAAVLPHLVALVLQDGDTPPARPGRRTGPRPR